MISRSILLVFIVSLLLAAGSGLQAQTSGKLKSGTDRSRITRKKEKERQKKKKFAARKSNSPLDKKYNSKQTRYEGTIVLNPKPKDYNEIKERVERNPERKNAKLFKNQRAMYRSSSGRIQRSYGAGPVGVNRGTATLSKDAKSGKSKGQGGMVARNEDYYRKRSKNVQRSKGGMKMVPPAKKRDYNEIKARVELNPERASMKIERSREAKARKNTEITQGFIGDVKVYSKAMQQNLTRRDSKLFRDYKGNQRIPNAKYQKQEEEGYSLLQTQEEGNVRVLRKKAQDRWYKKDASITGNYSGELLTMKDKYRKQQLQGKSLNSSQHQGEVKVYPRGRQDNWYRSDSKITGDYEGELITKREKYLRQELQGKSLNASQFEGNLTMRREKGRQNNLQDRSLKSSQYAGKLKVYPLWMQNRWYKQDAKTTGSYQGDLLVQKEKYRKQQLEGKSLNASQYEGFIKVYPKWMQDRWMRRDARITGDYQGNLLVIKPKYKAQQLEGKSLNASQYQGETKIRTNLGNKYHYRNISDRNQLVLGNFRIKSRFYRDLEHQVISARVHNYQGGPKISLFNRMWVNIFDRNAEETLRKKDNRIKKPQYDTREAEIWYE